MLEWLTNGSERGRNLSSQDLAISSPKWLLIFDDAEHPNDIYVYWPVGGTGSILVTSRDPLAKSRTYYESNEGMYSVASPYNVQFLTRSQVLLLSPLA